MTANKRFSRRDFLKLSAVVASGATLAACGAQPTATTAPVAQPAATTAPVAQPAATTAPVAQATATTAPPVTEVIKIRSSIWGDARDKVIWDGVAEDFMAAHPKIQVTTEQYVEQLGSGSYYDKIKVGIASGTAPDAWYMQGFGWGPYADNKTILPIDDLMKRDNFNGTPDFENFHYNCEWHGKTYLVPSDTGSVIMFYNKDVFDLFGEPYPQEGWTYEDFKAKVLKMSGDKNGTYYYGFANAGGWSGIYARAPHWLRKDGVLEWDTIVEPHKAQFLQDPIIEALQWTIVDATNNKWCPAPAALQGGGLTIASGQVAMTYEGPWYLSNMQGPQALKKGGVNFDVIHNPFGKSKRDETVAEIAGFEINIATKYVDAAWEWLKFQITDQAQKRIAEQGRMCGSPDTINKIWAPIASKNFNFTGTKYFAEAMKTGRSPIISGEGADLFTMMDTGTPLGVAWDAMSGGTPAKEALGMANPMCQTILDKYWAKKKA
jgi:multiple sugar transport system substrate-binding protein